MARLDELERKFDENPRRYFAPLANEYRKAGDAARAAELCRSQLPELPGHISGHIVLGQALYDAGDYAGSRAALETALALDPENIVALRYLGDISIALGDVEGAEGWYTRTLEADPYNEPASFALKSLRGAASLRSPDAALEPTADGAVDPQAPSESRGGALLEEETTPLSVDAEDKAPAVAQAAAAVDAQAPASADAQAAAAANVDVPAPAEAEDAGPAGVDAAAPADAQRGGAPAVPSEPVAAPTTTAEGDEFTGDLEVSTTGEPDEGTAATIEEPQKPRVDAAADTAGSAEQVSIAADAVGESSAGTGSAESPAAEGIIESDAEAHVETAAEAPGEPSAEAALDQAPAERAHEDAPLEAALGEPYAEAAIEPPTEPPGAEPLQPVAEATGQEGVAAVRDDGGLQSEEMVFEVAAPFVTETMADLYMEQGYPHEALELLLQLAEQRPDDESLREKIARIEAEIVARRDAAVAAARAERADHIAPAMDSATEPATESATEAAADAAVPDTVAVTEDVVEPAMSQSGGDPFDWGPVAEPAEHQSEPRTVRELFARMNQTRPRPTATATRPRLRSDFLPLPDVPSAAGEAGRATLDAPPSQEPPPVQRTSGPHPTFDPSTADIEDFDAWLRGLKGP